MRPEINHPSAATGQDSVSSAAAAGRAEPFAAERQALRRLLDNPEISRSGSLVRFLSYICQKYFDGQAEEIREFSIAVDALGRREGSFDSRVDPIVRVTARALRKKLKEYYETEGKDDPMRIVLPLGHYVPQFVPCSAQERFEYLNGDTEEDEASPQASDGQNGSASKEGGHRRIRLFFQRIPASFAWKTGATVALFLGVFAGGYLIGRHADRQPAVVAKPIQWGAPVWADEFDGALRQAPDPSKWTFDAGGGGWGDKQVQIYCSLAGAGGRACDPHRPNAFLDGAGHLVLRAEKASDSTWTSARISTRGLKEFQYGRIEARIKMPVGTGLWPSFWMLGSNFPSVGWPQSGSVSIVENVALNSGSNGLGPSVVRTTVHGPHYYGANGLWHDFHLPGGARVDDGGFHTYGILWSPGMIQFYVDDPSNVYFVADSSEIPEGSKWVFDHPFYLLMNLAVGGDWPGDPNATTPNPADMTVDYVRVYKIPPIPAPSIEWRPVAVPAGSTVASNVVLNAGGYLGRVHLTCATQPANAVCSLATPTVDFADTLTQQDTLTITTDSYADSGRVVAPPGRYKLTITATTMSGDHAQIAVPFDVKDAQ